MTSVFISYRRDDSKLMVDRIYAELCKRLGESNVFRDISGIEPGQDFRVALDQVLQRADIVLVVIGEKWLDIADDSGRRRLDNPADFVLREIAAGIHQPDTQVIPVPIGNAKIPPPEKLPDAIKELAFRQGAGIRPDPDFEHDFRRLMERIHPGRRHRTATLLACICIAALFVLAGLFYFGRTHNEGEAQRWRANWRAVSQPLLRRGDPQDEACAIHGDSLLAALALDVRGEMADVASRLRAQAKSAEPNAFYNLPFSEMHEQFAALREHVRQSAEQATGEPIETPKPTLFTATITRMNSLGKQVQELDSESFSGPIAPSRIGVAEWIQDSILDRFPVEPDTAKLTVTVAENDELDGLHFEPESERPYYSTYYWYVQNEKKDHQPYTGDSAGLRDLIARYNEVNMHFERPGYRIVSMPLYSGLVKELEFYACPIGVLFDGELAREHLTRPLSSFKRNGADLFQIRTPDQLRELEDLAGFVQGENIIQKIDKMNSNRVDFKVSLWVED